MRAACAVPGWAARMLVACDGSRTARERFEELLKGGQIPQDADPREFVRMLAGLMTAGVVRCERMERAANG